MLKKQSQFSKAAAKRGSRGFPRWSRTNQGKESSREKNRRFVSRVSEKRPSASLQTVVFLCNDQAFGADEQHDASDEQHEDFVSQQAAAEQRPIFLITK
jgi:hypothetical protein